MRTEYITVAECDQRHEERTLTFHTAIDNNTEALHELADTIRSQQRSLPMKDVMKLFSFFAILVLGLVAGVFGIREAFNVPSIVGAAAAVSSGVRHSHSNS